MITKKSLLSYMESYPDDAVIYVLGASGVPYKFDEETLLKESVKEDKLTFKLRIK